MVHVEELAANRACWRRASARPPPRRWRCARASADGSTGRDRAGRSACAPRAAGRAGTRWCPWPTGGCARGRSSPPGRPSSPGSGYIAGRTCSEPGRGVPPPASAGAGRPHAAARSRRRPPSRRRRGSSRGSAGAEVLHLLLHARQMAAGDMAGFVRQHADQLVRPLGAHDQAGVDEDALAARNEGVERAVLDDHDLDRAGIEAGRPPDRRHQGADGVLDLGVADQTEPLTLLRNGGTKRRQREQREHRRG